MSTPLYLLRTKRFAPLFGTQFLGAFNDNLYKNTLAVLLTFQATEWTSISSALLAPLIGAVFIAPFFLFSGLSGEIADRLDKARLARIVKVWEITMMIIAIAGFVTHSFTTLLFVVFGMGMHSTLFGPIKYSIIPQHMRENELIGANALIESGTFGAILLGTIAGGALAAIPNGGAIASSSALIVAVIGYLFSRFIPSAPPPHRAEPFRMGFWKHTSDAITLAYRDRLVFLAILAISWFWLYGALLLSQFPSLVKDLLMGSEETVTLILALFTLGIGVGSALCERLSHHHVRYSIVVVGGIGMAAAGADFAWGIGTFESDGVLLHNLYFWRIVVDVTLLGIFGGLYSVPLYALIQKRSTPEARSRIIAANNILNALFMVVGALATMMVLSMGYAIAWLFGLVALGTGFVGYTIHNVRRER
ncbi:MAG: MFS transporter [Sulfuricurvum sp.]|nr:MFS transporter [Sulfuricurvum sp.]